MPGQKHPIRVARLHIWVCVLLGALLLYNPFIALCYSHDTIEVHTLQRNRASVGASELQHFSPVQDDIQQTDLDLDSNREEVAAPAGSYLARGFEREVEVPQSDIAYKVWSRPPPLA
ncbi:MAG TPA: hypothetical protein VK728_11650 [Candidatus Sulfotelmatobacter sp.]|jgi:hypothetical protein|nr:hypothetical protein [Candidatus Sulfotelmatobacter sp.]